MTTIQEQKASNSRSRCGKEGQVMRRTEKLRIEKLSGSPKGAKGDSWCLVFFDYRKSKKPQRIRRKDSGGEELQGLGRCSAKFFGSSDGDDLRGGKREVDRRKQRRPVITGEKKKRGSSRRSRFSGTVVFLARSGEEASDGRVVDQRSIRRHFSLFHGVAEVPHEEDDEE
ncbi:hypothetical protein U1Q18_035196 [Sarracenia purpurea var. burkii]